MGDAANELLKLFGYEVKQKPEDTTKGVDTVLQFTLNLIKSGKTKQ